MLTNTICGMQVIQADRKNKLRRIGKVRSFVFYPREKKVAGILVKRPDAALMFHRKDTFVRFGAFTLSEEYSGLQIEDVPDATDSRAQRSLGIKLDECVLWWGMPVKNESGENLGYVDNIDFSWKTGAVNSIEVGVGGVAKTALMGKIAVCESDILGFKRTNDSSPSPEAKALMSGVEIEDASWEAEDVCGAILVSDNVRADKADGGIVQRAGRATAKTKYKVRIVSNGAKSKISKATGISNAKQAGEAVNRASYAAGEKIGKQMEDAKGMFKGFKEEFKRAYNSDDE